MTTCKTCPHCGGELFTVKRSASKATGNAKSLEQPTIIRDGKTYYGKKRKLNYKMSRLPNVGSHHLKGEIMKFIERDA